MENVEKLKWKSQKLKESWEQKLKANKKINQDDTKKSRVNKRRRKEEESKGNGKVGKKT